MFRISPNGRAVDDPVYLGGRMGSFPGWVKLTQVAIDSPACNLALYAFAQVAAMGSANSLHPTTHECDKNLIFLFWKVYGF